MVGGGETPELFFETGTFLKSELFFGPELFLSESDFFLSKDYLPVLPSSAKKEKKSYIMMKKCELVLEHNQASLSVRKDRMEILIVGRCLKIFL